VKTLIPAAFGVITATSFAFAGTAGAAPTGGSNAIDTVNQLRAQGYTVAVNVQNGPRSVPLAECKVTDVSGASGTNTMGKALTPSEAGTVYVDVNCPNDD
jgi:hypothetical protein